MKTILHPKLVDTDTATALFDYLLQNVPWIDGIYSSKLKRVSRKAYFCDFGNRNSEIDNVITELVISKLSQLGLHHEYAILGVYVNYYRDGHDIAPMHNHPKQTQMVISLGATRNIVIVGKTYTTENGDVIVFGSGMHAVPEMPEVTQPRISIATFMVKKTLLDTTTT